MHARISIGVVTLCLLSALADASDTAVTISTLFGETSGQGTFASDPIHAHTSIGDGFEGAGAYGEGDASIAPQVIEGVTVVLPRLGAYASGNSNGDHRIGGVANVTTSLGDELHPQVAEIEDTPKIGQMIEQNALLYFKYHLHGDLHGHGSSVNFDFDVDTLDQNGNPVGFSSNRSAQGPGTVTEVLLLKIPARAAFGAPDSSNFPRYALLNLTLAVSGGSSYDSSSHFIDDGWADFLQTAALDAIYIADENGRYLAASEGVFIAGSGGRYPKATVPPSGLLVTDSIVRPRIGTSAGHALISGRALPGMTVLIQAAPTAGATYSDIGTVVADDAGHFAFEDSSAVGLGRRFYRAAYP